MPVSVDLVQFGVWPNRVIELGQTVGLPVEGIAGRGLEAHLVTVEAGVPDPPFAGERPGGIRKQVERDAVVKVQGVRGRGVQAVDVGRSHQSSSEIDRLPGRQRSKRPAGHQDGVITLLLGETGRELAGKRGVTIGVDPRWTPLARDPAARENRAPERNPGRGARQELGGIDKPERIGRVIERDQRHGGQPRMWITIDQNRQGLLEVRDARPGRKGTAFATSRCFDHRGSLVDISREGPPDDPVVEVPGAVVPEAGVQVGQHADVELAERPGAVVRDVKLEARNPVVAGGGPRVCLLVH